jgi:hypothetical protein
MGAAITYIAYDVVNYIQSYLLIGLTERHKLCNASVFTIRLAEREERSTNLRKAASLGL